MKVTSSTNLWLTILVAGVLGVATESNAAKIDLSGISSEPTIAPSLLGAGLDFVVTDGDTLTLTVDNQSEFDIMAIFFNASSSVTGLTLDSGPKKWLLADAMTAGSFGSFDFALVVPANKAGKDGFDPGGSTVFALTLTSDGLVDGWDFTAELSVDGDVSAYAAAMFEGKSGEVLGAAQVPEPSSALLLALALGLGGIVQLGGRRNA
jgi:hypothetical protein